MVVSAAVAERDRSAAPRPPAGSVARQLMLKYRLRKIADGTLTASLNHNREQWERLSPDQREEYRRDMVAFLDKSPERQKALLKHYENLARLSVEKQAAYQRRTAWLKPVVASFTPDERKALRELSPRERARKLLRRRDELAARGEVALEAPKKTPATTRSTEPTTQPAAK